MIWENIETSIRKALKNRWVKWQVHSPTRIYVDIEIADFLQWIQFLVNEVPSRFITASALDTPRGKIEILYHFAFHGLPQVLLLRVSIPKENPEIESIAPFLKAGEWIEREMAELFGIRFLHHPNLKRLLLPENWPEGKYPLRRDQ